MCCYHARKAENFNYIVTFQFERLRAILKVFSSPSVEDGIL